jgi:hypothetical protein
MLVVHASILQPDGVIAPMAAKKVVVCLFQHTASKLPAVVPAGGWSVPTPTGAGIDQGLHNADGTTTSSCSSSNSRSISTIFSSSSSKSSKGKADVTGSGSSSGGSVREADYAWHGVPLGFVERKPPAVEPPTRGRPATAIHWLECNSGALACAMAGQPEAERRTVVEGAIREVERRGKFKVDYSSIHMQVSRFWSSK